MSADGSGGGDDDGDGDGDDAMIGGADGDDLGADDLAVYEAAQAASRAKKRQRTDDRSTADRARRTLQPDDPDQLTGPDERREINREIESNRGLVKYRRRDMKNPRY